MKKWRIIAGLLLSLGLVGSTACDSIGGGEEKNTQQLVEVMRGDLALTVSGSGNIEVSDDVELTFGIAGRLDEILVEEGDEVSEGEVLARLETDALELALAQAEVAYTQAEVAILEADVAVTQAELAITTAEAAVTQAEINLKDAEINLEQTIITSTVSDIRVAQAEVTIAKRDLDDALWTLYKYDPGTTGYEEYSESVVQAEARLNTAEDRLDAMLAGFSSKEIASKEQQVVAAEQSLETARQSMEATRQSLWLAKQSPGLSQQSLELARQSRDNAQTQLDKATMTAPFTGTVASVFVDEGDTILTTTTIVHLIVPGRMELKVQVDEIDMPDMETGQKVIIEVDALPDLPMEGKISFISLLPTVEGGVIVYDVTIDFDVPQGVGLRAGMSASTDIIVVDSKNVLLVPSRAIKKDSDGNSVVEVSMVGGENEEREVTVGISDGFQTEIVSGLEEGEMVIEK
ncbi:efflux RND transporter periplasmic adaptor subunit [Chloroflexota bacterium]